MLMAKLGKIHSSFSRTLIACGKNRVKESTLGAERANDPRFSHLTVTGKHFRGAKVRGKTNHYDLRVWRLNLPFKSVKLCSTCPTFSVLFPLDLGHPAQPHEPRDDLLQLLRRRGRLEPAQDVAISLHLNIMCIIIPRGISSGSHNLLVLS